MPIKPKRGPARKGGNELTFDQLDYLVSGQCLDAGAPGERWDVDGMGMPFRSMAEMEAAYKKHQAAVEAKVQEERAWAKHLRSWGWWKYIAPEPRQHLSGPEPISHLPITRGIPDFWDSYEVSRTAVYETEFAYLERLDLLQSGDAEEVIHAVIYKQGGKDNV